MLRAAFAALGLSLAALVCSAEARTPTVVELFTSQGCSSCVASGDLIGDLAARPNVLPLTFSVDYWDYLGWADTFAKPEFAERQRDYLKRLAVRGGGVTPQVVVDGRLQITATKPDQVEALVTEARKQPHDPPDMVLKSDRVVIGSGKAGKGGADVWLVRYDPSPQPVQVKRGDNRGRTVVERNVVQELIRVGSWSGRSKAFRLPKPSAEGLKTVIILQAVHGGRILDAHAG
ncbi:MAG TPA: DUF1223 domain-containing protein [Caulobacteraceae bacterium]|jgi:hypothetical protein|nr:DUF1223 domain-containing protein [Caulobacteraceae bacterium]